MVVNTFHNNDKLLTKIGKDSHSVVCSSILEINEFHFPTNFLSIPPCNFSYLIGLENLRGELGINEALSVLEEAQSFIGVIQPFNFQYDMGAT